MVSATRKQKLRNGGYKQHRKIGYVEKMDRMMETNVTNEERNWAAIAHASTLLGVLAGILSGGVGSIFLALVPLGIYVAFKERSRYVAFHALQALVLQLGGLIIYAIGLAALIFLTVVAWVVAGVLTVILIGVLLMPVAMIVTLVLVLFALVFPFFVIAYGLYGAVETGRGTDFRYRWIGDWLEGTDIFR